MTVLGRLILLGVAVCGLFTDALAQERASGEAPPAVSKPKPSLHPDRVDGSWTLITEDAEMSVLIDFELPLETSRVWLRYELWPSKGQASTSVRTLYETDCRKRTVREALSVVYPQNNLQGGANFSSVVGKARKASSRSIDGQILSTVCEVEAGVARKALAAGRESDPAAAARENARFKVARTGAWHALAIKDSVKLYVRGAESANFPRLEVRLERLSPVTLGGQPVLSSRHVVDVDCDAYEYRLAATTVYARNNLKGQSLQLAADIDWKSMEDDIFAGLITICDPRLEGLEKLGPLAMNRASTAG